MSPILDAMVPIADWAVLAAIPGHISWLLFIDNRVHATAWNYHLIKLIGFVLKTSIVGGALAAAAWYLARVAGFSIAGTLSTGLQIYVVACATISILGTLPWLYRRLTFREAAALVADESKIIDLRPVLGNPPEIAKFVGRLAVLPGNQLLSIAVHEKRLAVPRTPPALVGLKLVHLSDVHMTGRIGRPFYERIAELANDADPDLVLLTGDLIENTDCRDWIPTTFARLRAKYGVYFVLGNHDVRIEHLETRRRLEDAGLVNVGGRSVQVSIDGVDVLIAGSERPWIDDGPLFRDPPPPRSAAEFRLFISHSPDEYAWARAHAFDLMLAGHVHGGQIRIPPIGPILAPSRFGVRYASGVFHESPTVLHVSRGASSKAPFRFFCPPELATLILTAPG